jgi:hypothetical protein
MQKSTALAGLRTYEVRDCIKTKRPARRSTREEGDTDCRLGMGPCRHGQCEQAQNKAMKSLYSMAWCFVMKGPLKLQRHLLLFQTRL